MADGRGHPFALLFLVVSLTQADLRAGTPRRSIATRLPWKGSASWASPAALEGKRKRPVAKRRLRE